MVLQLLGNESDVARSDGGVLHWHGIIAGMRSETYRELTRFFLRRWSGTEGMEIADTLFVNATIWTGDARQSWVQWMAVVDGRRLSLGHSSEMQVPAVGYVYLCTGPHWCMTGFGVFCAFNSCNSLM